MRTLHKETKVFLLCVIAVTTIILFSCQDFTPELPAQIHLTTSGGLDIKNSSGQYYDTVVVGASYSAIIDFSKGDFKGNISEVITGDGSFSYKLTSNKSVFHLSTVIKRVGTYTYMYYWKVRQGECDLPVSEAVVVRLMVVEGPIAL